MSDRGLVTVAAGLRGLSTAVTGACLGVYAGGLGHGPAAVGLVTSAGLVGGALATLLLTLRGDVLGRRRSLLVLSALGAVAGSAALSLSALPLVVAASFLALWNGMGRDRGPAAMLEQALLPATVSEAGRTTAFARYNALQDATNALGFLAVAGLLALPFGARAGADSPQGPLRALLALHPLVCLVSLALYARLSPAVEATAAARRAPLTPAGRRVVLRISALFLLDSVGGGFLAASLVSYFLFERFGVGVPTIALLYFVARVLNALSHLAAARLARRIGLVNTMVFTHLPSSLLLATVAVAPSFEVAATLFLLRESLVEMDVPTRQSYVMAVVAPEDRTAASGITSLVRLAGWALGPALAGPLMQGVSLGLPLAVGAALKIAYDLLLWRSFRGLPAPEERAARAARRGG